MNYLGKAITIACLLLVSIINGQSQDLEYSGMRHDLESKSLVILYSVNTIEKAVNDSKPKEDNENLSAELGYDESVADDFGAYVNPFSNSLKVSGQSNVDYTRFQLVSKDSGKTILKSELTKGKNEIDLVDVAPGAYILIMTDSGMNIYSEEFSIL